MPATAKVKLSDSMTISANVWEMYTPAEQKFFLKCVPFADNIRSIKALISKLVYQFGSVSLVKFVEFGVIEFDHYNPVKYRWLPAEKKWEMIVDESDESAEPAEPAEPAESEHVVTFEYDVTSESDDSDDSVESSESDYSDFDSESNPASDRSDDKPPILITVTDPTQKTSLESLLAHTIALSSTPHTAGYSSFRNVIIRDEDLDTDSELTQLEKTIVRFPNAVEIRVVSIGHIYPPALLKQIRDQARDVDFTIDCFYKSSSTPLFERSALVKDTPMRVKTWEPTCLATEVWAACMGLIDPPLIVRLLENNQPYNINRPSEKELHALKLLSAIESRMMITEDPLETHWELLNQLLSIETTDELIDFCRHLKF